MTEREMIDRLVQAIEAITYEDGGGRFVSFKDDADLNPILWLILSTAKKYLVDNWHPDNKR